MKFKVIIGVLVIQGTLLCSGWSRVIDALVIEYQLTYHLSTTPLLLKLAQTRVLAKRTQRHQMKKTSLWAIVLKSKPRPQKCTTAARCPT